MFSALPVAARELHVGRIVGNNVTIVLGNRRKTVAASVRAWLKRAGAMRLWNARLSFVQIRCERRPGSRGIMPRDPCVRILSRIMVVGISAELCEQVSGICAGTACNIQQ